MAAPSRYDLVINLAYPTDRKPWLGAPIVTLLRSLILNPAAIWAIGCVLLAWFLGSAAIALIGCRRLITELRAARERITETADSIAFARDYESVSDMLSALRILGPRWREFRDSLLVPETGGRPVSATVPANAWFELSPLLRAAGLDPRYHGALPNLLVGAGLLFTFAGLAASPDWPPRSARRAISSLKRRVRPLATRRCKSSSMPPRSSSSPP